MIRFSAPLLSLAAEFTGKYAPFQGVQISPHPDGGVLVISTDKGHVACLGHDPKGLIDEPRHLIVPPDLARAAAAIKAAERDVQIEGPTAVVTTYRKSTNDTKQFQVFDCVATFPPIREVLATCIERWGATPETTTTAGRYDADLLTRAIKAAKTLTSSIVITSYDGGPLRLQGEGIDALVLLMPQTAEPIPPVPTWAQALCPVTTSVSAKPCMTEHAMR